MGVIYISGIMYAGSFHISRLIMAKWTFIGDPISSSLSFGGGISLHNDTRLIESVLFVKILKPVCRNGINHRLRLSVPRDRQTDRHFPKKNGA